MSVPDLPSPGRWPVLRQLRGADKLGRGAAVKSRGSDRLHGAHAHRRPGRQVGVPVLRRRLRAERLRQGRARSSRSRAIPTRPHSRGRLCPKGSASLQLTTGSSRERARALPPRRTRTDWQRLDLETAMDMVADRVVATRARGLGVGARRASACGAA